jgi:tRNA1(Val) A37 N6-methylase TrmN6
LSILSCGYGDVAITIEIQLVCSDVVDYLAGVPPGQFDVVLMSPPFKEEDVEGDYWAFLNTI